MQETWVRSLGWEDPLKKWPPTPVFLPGESPWAEKPGRLQSKGLQRVRHDWAHNTSALSNPRFFYNLVAPATAHLPGLHLAALLHLFFWPRHNRFLLSSWPVHLRVFYSCSCYCAPKQQLQLTPLHPRRITTSIHLLPTYPVGFWINTLSSWNGPIQ